MSDPGPIAPPCPPPPPSPCSWLIAIAFWLAGGFIKSGLGNRIAYGLVAAFGKTTLGLTYSLVLGEALLSPAIPSVAARAGEEGVGGGAAAAVGCTWGTQGARRPQESEAQWDCSLWGCAGVAICLQRSVKASAAAETTGLSVAGALLPAAAASVVPPAGMPPAAWCSSHVAQERVLLSALLASSSSAPW